ncbi:MAG: helix-turn-helix transcriptional regulator [Actinomycetia bacterium]|nr:helix-turn-helix transcriptional regulator [Actinomycetes bacterium]MCP4963015.1 helix-turn-helix transcriptional regulator [Actinomycetes bacterium]
MTTTSPRRDEFDAIDSITRTLDLVGDRWTLLVIRGVFRGVRRFSQLHDDLGIARNLLSDRLQKLVDADILHKIPYQERPVRHEYHLTDRGRELSPALIALMRWGDRWCSDGKPPVVLTHSVCGTEVSLAVTCPTCRVEVPATEIEAA